MPGLGDIPREITILIYILCPDASTALQLSLINREHRLVWINNFEHITRAILEPETSAYDDAVELARIETWTLKPIALRSSSTDGESLTSSQILESEEPQSSAHLWIPRLQRNAELAVAVCAECEAYETTRSPDCYRWKMTFTSWPESYYFIRLLVLSFHFAQLRPPLLARLDGCSIDTLNTCLELCEFMNEWMSDEEQIRHSIPKEPEQRTIEDELIMNANKPEWDDANEVIREAWVRNGGLAALK